jgi:outer membrane lipoprotein-sorting protein
METNRYTHQHHPCRTVPLLIALLMALAITSLPALAFSQSAKEIVNKANELLHGKSSTAIATMTVIKQDWTRQMSTKLWMLEPDYAMILLTAPAKDRGTVTLKRENEIWNWIPAIQRIIKIPPSMMMQPWMGSDFTNDDLVRESSIVDDYTHTLIGEESIDGHDCYKIRLLPKPDAGVVWEKVVVWITKDGYQELRTEYYGEDGNLVKYMTGSELKEMGGRVLPSHWEMIPVDKPGEKTVLDYQSMEFNVDIGTAFFSRQRMKQVR